MPGWESIVDSGLAIGFRVSVGVIPSRLIVSSDVLGAGTYKIIFTGQASRGCSVTAAMASILIPVPRRIQFIRR